MHKLRKRCGIFVCSEFQIYQSLNLGSEYPFNVFNPRLTNGVGWGGAPAPKYSYNIKTLNFTNNGGTFTVIVVKNKFVTSPSR
jgi:hypothetical protein